MAASYLLVRVFLRLHAESEGSPRGRCLCAQGRRDGSQCECHPRLSEKYRKD